MASNNNDYDKIPSIRGLVTPKGTAVFPRLNDPDTKFKEAGEYSARIQLDTTAPQFAAFKAKVDAVLEETQKFYTDALEVKVASAGKASKGKAVKNLNTLKEADPFTVVLDEEGNDTEYVTVNFKMRASGVSKKSGKAWSRRPVLKDGGNRVLDPDTIKVGGGTLMRAAGDCVGYYAPNDNRYGVSFRLEAVKILKLVEWGSSDVDFGDEDDDEDYEDLSGRKVTTQDAPSDAPEDDGNDNF